jgi:hypothetical protein
MNEHARLKYYVPSNKQTQNGIEYDLSRLSIVSPEEISMFIEYQLQHPDTINACFEKLILIIEMQEIHETQINTRTRTKTKTKSGKQMDDIYQILKDQFTALTGTTNIDLSLLDKWVLFIKSQGEFSEYF